MTDTILDSLVVKIRADSTELRGQLSAIERDFGALDKVAATTADAMTRGFETFARSGELSFASLKRAALSALSEIANSALQSGLDSLFGEGSGIGAILGDFAGSLFSGRAGGGAVSARRPYMVGERGPELFVPEHPGRILPRQDIAAGGGAGRAGPNITINISNHGGAGAEMTRRSAGQVAVAVRRAMARADRNM